MKNNRNFQNMEIGRSLCTFTKKIPLVMKLFIFYLFCSIGMLQAVESYAQNARLSLNVEEETVANVLRQIEDASDFDFFYNNSHVDLNRRVSVSAQNSDIFAILKEIFEGTEVRYTVLDKKIILSTELETSTQGVQQEGNVVKGKVMDAHGEPVIGATIKEVGTSNGTVTDMDGNFTINTQANATLEVSFIGYQSQTLKAVTGKELAITLKEDTEMLDEVVVVGYGSQKKGSITGSITSVNAEAIEEFPSANLSTALAGRLSGVYISQGTGKPGAAASFSIRAKGTPNNADPLYVIDGAIRDKMAFDALDASEVANISVLKDGASAAVYGSRAANGVVLVTTKRGGGAKPVINYTGTIGVDMAAMIPETLTAYEHATYLNDRAIQGYINNKIWNPNGEYQDPTTTASWYTDDELEHFKTTDYCFLDDAWRTPWTTRHAINITGGTEKVRYFIGGSYYYNVGSFDNLKYSKYNFRASIDADISKDFTVGLNISTDNRKDTKPNWRSDGDRDRMNDLYKGLLLRTKMIPSMIDGKPVGNFIEWHPLMLISEQSGLHTKKWQNININANAEYKVPFVPGLKLKIQYNRTLDNRLIKKFNYPYDMYIFETAGTNNHYINPENIVVSTKTRDDGNYVFKENTLSENYQLNFFVTYERKFNKHDLGALFVYEQAEGNEEAFDAQRNNLISWEMPEFFGASGDASQSTVGDGSVEESGRLSYVGRLNYAYDDKYLVEAAFRVDGSTKFAPSQRWGFFPSISAGWRISSEPFFAENIKFIDYMKLRGSIATLGNDEIGGWQWMARYGITTGAVFSGLTYGLAPKEVPNPQLTWEKSTSYNVGFDSRWFHNKIDFSFEYFQRRTYDILDNLTVSVPTTYGASLPKENYSEVKSRGFEVELGYNDKIGNVDYYIKGNFGYANSWWTKKDEAENIRAYKSEIGQSLNREWGYECIGMIRTEEQLEQYMKENPNMTILGQKPGLGMLIYKDVRGPESDEPDGIITTDDKVVIIDKKIAPITYGFSIGGKWNNFMLDIFFQGMAGNKKLMDFRGNGINAHTSTFKWYEDHWTPENTDASMPGATQYKNNEASTFWVRNGSFLRCKNISLSYDLPQSFTKRLGIDKVRLFLNGTNLFLLQDKVKWMDPEATSISDYPVMRNFSFGVNVTI